jgi:hypothetical protein
MLTFFPENDCPTSGLGPLGALVDAGLFRAREGVQTVDCPHCARCASRNISEDEMARADGPPPAALLVFFGPDTVDDELTDRRQTHVV